MKKIIVTGGSGFLGAKLSQILTISGYEVLAIGRKKFSTLNSIRKEQLKNVIYFDSDLRNDSLEKIIDYVKWDKKEIYSLFHVAWGGETGLSDLNSDEQFKNLKISLDLFKSAEKIGITKYIFTGTMEEFFAEEYLNLDHNKNTVYNRHVIYALAKLWTRRRLEIIGSKSKTDLIFITNSHVIGPGDDKDSFLQVSLSKMIHNEEINMSSGVQLFDVIDVEDCAKTYLAILKKGKRLQHYMAGSGNPMMLKEYIYEMQTLFPAYKKLFIDKNKKADVVLDEKHFDTSNVINDTGFEPAISFIESIKRLSVYISEENVRY